MKRRRFLATAGLAATATAGCLGGSGTAPAGDGDGTAAGEGREGGNESGEADVRSRAGTEGLADQPALGPDPFEATATIVAWEDPSCPTCRRFETETFPEIRSTLVEGGSTSFVFRVFPVIYPWGEPASQALESTFARSEDAFWALKAHYYESQSEFDESNVLDRTESFLADEADVDAAAVVADAESEAHDDAVQADLQAGRAAGFSATPSFLLFRDGDFVTELAGAKSFSVFESALQL